MDNPADLLALLAYLSPDQQAEVEALCNGPAPIWSPLPGPQTLAMQSEADIIGFGGAAGGGKTDLAAGLALTEHRASMILRPIGTELLAVRRRIGGILGSMDGYSSKDNVFNIDAFRFVDFGALPDPGDETKYQGRDHDLLVFDEASNFRAYEIRFLSAWNRTTIPGQRCRMLLTFNPPTSAEGRWIIEFFAPWLDPNHPCPALPGELRYFVVVADPQGNSHDVEVVDKTPCVQVSGTVFVTTDFDPADYRPEEIMTPKSRTFIPSRIINNPYLMGTGYMAQLQALPEPLRSQMLNGDFQAGVEDAAMQLIPTEWVDIAMARWRPRTPKGEMVSLGIDVARGGKDYTILAPKHEGNWFDELKAYPGKKTPDGPIVAGLAVMHLKDHAVIHIDVIGVGASPYDTLNGMGLQVVGVNVATASKASDKSGMLSFSNLRSETWWKFRELLDPANDTGVALPPDPKLKADLTAPLWKLVGAKIYVESREEIFKRIQRSPDYGSAIVLAHIETPKIASMTNPGAVPARPPHNPLERMSHDISVGPASRGYHPMDRIR